jgi:hypothetical protein
MSETCDECRHPYAPSVVRMNAGCHCDCHLETP